MVKSRFLGCSIGILMLCLIVPYVFAVNSDEAQAAISRAESRISVVYESVLEAEGDGADISGLLLKLNNCSALLAKAKMQYRFGNFSEAVSFANQCFDSLSGIEVEADMLKDSVVMEKKQRLLVSAVGSAFAVGAVVYAGIFGWRFFKGKYCKRVLKMKPEVQHDDSG